MRIKQRIIFIILTSVFLFSTFYFLKNNNSNATIHFNSIKNIKQFVLNIEDYANFTDSYCQANFPNYEKYIKPKNAKLKMVHIVTRHGDRTPTHALPNENITWDVCNYVEENQVSSIPNFVVNKKIDIDLEHNPYAKQIYWEGNCGIGQLTDKGIKQHKSLGKNLRLIYLNDDYDENNDNVHVKEWFWGVESMSKEDYEKELNSNNIGGRIWAKSTERSRTMVSAQAFLSEFIPNAKNVSLNITPRYLELLIPNALSCRRLGGFVERMKLSSQYKRKVKETENSFKLLEKILGTEKSQLTFERYFDTLQGRRCWNKPLPCSEDGSLCVDESLANSIINMGDWERAYQYNIRGWDGALELAKMRVGPLLIEFLTNMLHRIQGLDKRRFLLYSAHDSTISAVLGVLLDEPLHWPGYASNFIIELWESTEKNMKNKYFFRVLYNGQHVKIDRKSVV